MNITIENNQVIINLDEQATANSGWASTLRDSARIFIYRSESRRRNYLSLK